MSGRTDDDGTILVVNGRVRTLEPDRPVAEALLVEAGRITIVGGLHEVREMAGRTVPVLDAQGGTVLPAFGDGHTHFKRASVFMSLYLDFDSLRPGTVQDVVDAVSARARRTPEREWIQGDGLNPAHLVENRFPTRRELDAATTDHPVVLRGVGRHVVAANSAALALAGIDETTPDPPGGHIERDEHQRPTGVLHEEAKLRLDADRGDTVIPPPSVEQRLEALAEGSKLLASQGIGTIHEIPRTADQVGDWLRLRERHRPTVRVRFYIRGVAAQTRLDQMLGLGLRSGFGDPWIRLAGMKVSVDGSVSHRNAMVHEPYPGTTSRGLERVPYPDLVAALRDAHLGGLQVAVHAIGQRAVDHALSAFEEIAGEGHDVASARHRIEHAFLPPRPGQLDRMSRLGLVLSTQPGFITSSGDRWAEVFEDPRLDGVMPIASAVRAGVRVMLNTDFPNSPLSPFVGLHAAVTRRTASGIELDPSEAITAEAALRMMTHATAHATFEEAERGLLATGYDGDLTVVDRDPVDASPDSLADIRVTDTVVGGHVVFSQSGR